MPEVALRCEPHLGPLPADECGHIRVFRIPRHPVALADRFHRVPPLLRGVGLGMVGQEIEVDL
ncbi:MAG: hypothetical protein QGE95_16160, partial [Arenicellales bacterium]|nr:hypothetical protein [Arenicellales bacterium]